MTILNPSMCISTYLHWTLWKTKTIHSIWIINLQYFIHHASKYGTNWSQSRLKKVQSFILYLMQFHQIKLTLAEEISCKNVEKIPSFQNFLVKWEGPLQWDFHAFIFVFFFMIGWFSHTNNRKKNPLRWLQYILSMHYSNFKRS